MFYKSKKETKYFQCTLKISWLEINLMIIELELCQLRGCRQIFQVLCNFCYCQLQNCKPNVRILIVIGFSGKILSDFSLKYKRIILILMIQLWNLSRRLSVFNNKIYKLAQPVCYIVAVMLWYWQILQFKLRPVNPYWP